MPNKQTWDWTETTYDLVFQCFSVSSTISFSIMHSGAFHVIFPKSPAKGNQALSHQALELRLGKAHIG